MRRVSPKLLVLIAAVLTVALLAFVFAGSSSRSDRPRNAQLTDGQAAVTAPRPAEPPADTWAGLPGGDEAVPAPAPPPEPEIEPGPSMQSTPVVRPAPPPQPRRSAAAEALESAKARTQAKASAEASRAAARRKTATAATPDQRPGPSPKRIAKAPASPPIATARPSYNCRYARTRSEIAVCGDAELASLDRQMASQFNTALRQATVAQREVLERSRLRFLYRRERCRTTACIAAAYQARMSEINDIAARHWRDP